MRVAAKKIVETKLEGHFLSPVVVETLLVTCTDKQKNIYIYYYFICGKTSADFHDRVRDNGKSSWERDC